MGDEIGGEEGVGPRGTEVINLLFLALKAGAQNRCGNQSAADPGEQPVAGVQFPRPDKFPFEPLHRMFNGGPQNTPVGLKPEDSGSGHEEFVHSRLDDPALRVHGQHSFARSETLDRGLAPGSTDQRAPRKAPAPFIVDGKATGEKSVRQVGL